VPATSACEFAMKCELIEFQRNPILSVEIRGFRQRVRKKQVLTPEQFQTLLCNADLRLQAMMTLACSLGLRPSEFLGLQWPDLDVSRGVLMVSRSITGQHIEPPERRIPRMRLHLIPTFWLCCCGGRNNALILRSSGSFQTWTPAGPSTPIL
jgi:integrase